MHPRANSRRTFLSTAAVAAAASLPGCMVVAPAAASICRVAPYIPPTDTSDPVFLAIERWRPLQAKLDAAFTTDDEDLVEQHFGPASRALSAIYEAEPTTPAGLIALMVVMFRQDSPHLGIDHLDESADDLQRGLRRMFQSAERLLNGSMQS